MSSFPTPLLKPLVHINPTSLEAWSSPGFVNIASLAASSTSTTWPSANLALFYPFRIFTPIIVTLLYTYNGSVASGNLDVGIYDMDGNQIVSSGSTAQTGTSTIQELNISDTPLNPGKFYLAMAMDNTTGTITRYAGPSNSELTYLGIAQQASAFPLPATATPTTASVSNFPIFGLSTRTFV